MIHDENEFQFLRHQLMKQATMHEYRRAARTAKTMNYDDFPANVHPLVKAKLVKRRERAKSVILHRTHEQRFCHYKRTIHQMWRSTFHDTPRHLATLIVGIRNNPNLGEELVRRDPFSKNGGRNTSRPTNN